MNVLDFAIKKKHGDKICMVTCYDYISARILSETELDGLLVGDSAAMMIYGYENTLPMSLEMMCHHTAAVRRGTKRQFIISDLPFLSFRKSFNFNISAAQKLMQAGAHALKMEGANGNLKLIRHLTESGVPVMGHLGLTPQYLHALGGYKLQGITSKSATLIMNEAHQLQEAGCFAIVLECIPTSLAQSITQKLAIPTIGIGAGADTDGQVLVFHDVLGLNKDFAPKFVKAFIKGDKQIKKGVTSYIDAVKKGLFPDHEHTYHDQN